MGARERVLRSVRVRGVGEHAVYVATEAQGRGIGRLLHKALATVAEEAGYHKLTSRVFTTNEATRTTQTLRCCRSVI
jgi:L-amino acid N-acyltransferase YncA